MNITNTQLFFVDKICYFLLIKYENPLHEKTNNLHMRKKAKAQTSRGNREDDQHLCFRYTDSTIPLLLKSEISSS